MTDLSAEEVIENMRGWSDLAAYFQGQKGTWDGDVAAAKAAYDALARNLKDVSSSTFFVDQALGDDEGTGTENDPLQSIDRAFVLSDAYGSSNIFIVGDYLQSEAKSLPLGRVHIRSADTVNRSTLRFASVAEDDASATAHFKQLYASSTVLINGIDLEMAASDPSVTGVNAMFQIGGGASLVLRALTISELASSTQAVMSLHSVGSLSVSSVVTPDLSGRWLQDVPSGTLVANVPRLAGTTLATL